MTDWRRPLLWLAGEIKTPPFSSEARVEAGLLLRRIQRGELLSFPESRPMPSVRQRCHELRIIDRNESWRIMYRLDSDALIILDVFKKQTRTTPGRVIDRCQRRLRAYDSTGEEE